MNKDLELATTPTEVISPLGELGETIIDHEAAMLSAVERLAKLSAIQYDRVRRSEADALGIRSSTLDTAVKSAKKSGGTDDDSPFEEIEPWPKPVNGAALLTTIVATIKRFIICEQHTATAAALWIVMTWFMDIVQVAPLAMITAPEKRCGKTLLLTLIGKLTPRTLTSSSITPAALFRSIDLWRPTLLIDETDACLKDNEELRGLINCGHTRDSAFTIRCVGEDHTPTKFSTWGAKALSGIGDIASTLMDRSIKLELRRKLPGETVERIRYAEPGLFNELASKIARFADDNGDRVLFARPDLPPSLNDRAQDNWEPLLSIAMVAGGNWFNTATSAALKLSGDESSSLSIGAELLADIQAIFERKKIVRISSADLIIELCIDDESPWATFNKGFPIKPRQIAAKLKGYGIHSKSIRIGSTETPKGYEANQFKETFMRYIPANTDISATTPQSSEIVDVRTVLNATQPQHRAVHPQQVTNSASEVVAVDTQRCRSVADMKVCKPTPTRSCGGVADNTEQQVSEVHHAPVRRGGKI